MDQDRLPEPIFDQATGQWVSRAEVASTPRSPARRRPSGSPAGSWCAIPDASVERNKAAGQPHATSRKDPAWSARVRCPARRETTHSGVPASSSAVAWLCPTSAGSSNGGPMPSLRSAAVVSRTVSSRNAASSGRPLQVHEQSRVRGHRQAERGGVAGQLGQVVKVGGGAAIEDRLDLSRQQQWRAILLPAESHSHQRRRGRSRAPVQMRQQSRSPGLARRPTQQPLSDPHPGRRHPANGRKRTAARRASIVPESRHP